MWRCNVKSALDSQYEVVHSSCNDHEPAVLSWAHNLSEPHAWCNESVLYTTCINLLLTLTLTE